MSLSVAAAPPPAPGPAKMPRDVRDSTCRVCSGWEPETIDRLLAVGYGPRFISARWGHTRQVVAQHRDRCLTGGRLAATEASLLRMAASAGGG
jgi:hypothetical protein